jgi:two-component system sensor histidine kinase/response regulator
MVSELLDQARLEAGMLLLDVAHFKPVDVLENLQVTARVLAGKKGLELTTELAADVPLHLVGDAPRLLQILNNLTGNAIKFTEEGSVHVHIFCPNETQWALQVSDTGPGISEEAQALVFDPFRQLDGSITRRHGGSGLGLSIVKKLSELMGGEVFIDSEEGRGSTFTVVLPLKPTLEMA